MRRLVVVPFLLALVVGPALGWGRSASWPDSATAGRVEASVRAPGSATGGDLSEAVAPDTTPPPPEAQEATQRLSLPGALEMPPYGTSGPQVVAFQQALVAGGFDPGPVDGQYGPRTAAAARAAGYDVAVPAPAPSTRVTPTAPTISVWDGTLHAHPFLVCTRRYESDRGDANGNGLHDGGYLAYNGAGPYLGAFQFLQSTWNSTAAASERPDLIGVDPRYAGDGNQDAMAWSLYQMAGNRPWGSRC